MVSVTVFGAAGRMGAAALRALAKEEDIEVTFAVDVPENAGKTVEGFEILADDPAGSWDTDVWVDVSLADSAYKHALRAESASIPILIGATGLSLEQRTRLEALRTAIIIAPNLSLGINLFLDLVGKVAKTLGPDYDIGIVETHHKHKVDAPSGTASALAEQLHRAGAEVQITSLRLGEVVGEHRVIFASDGEEIELTHRAESRQAFARGIAPAVRFLKGRTSGRFDMMDVLGLRDG